MYSLYRMCVCVCVVFSFQADCEGERGADEVERGVVGADDHDREKIDRKQSEQEEGEVRKMESRLK